MFKVSGLATMLAVALCCFAQSCAGPVFFKPPAASVASTPAASTPAVASTGTPGASAAAHAGTAQGKAVIAGASTPGAAGDTVPTVAPAGGVTPVVATTPPAVPAWNGGGIFLVFVAGLFLVLTMANVLLRHRAPGHT